MSCALADRGVQQLAGDLRITRPKPGIFRVLAAPNSRGNLSY